MRLFLDYESYNLCLHEIHNAPWQAAFFECDDNNNIIEKHNFYLRWPVGKYFISQGAAEKTGFSQSIIDQQGLPPEEVFDTLAPLLERADTVVMHNGINFDTYITTCLYRALGHKPINILPKIRDTHCVAKGMKLDSKPSKNEKFEEWQLRILHTKAKGVYTRLEVLGEEFGIKYDPTKLHQADADLDLNVLVDNRLRKYIS